MNWMRRRRLAVTAITVLMGAAWPAVAQETRLSGESGRYQMQPIEGGIARLDTRTGAISLCRVEDGALACQSSATNAAESAEINDGLAETLSGLSGRIDALDERLDGLERRAGLGANRVAPQERIPLDEMREALREFGHIFREMDREFGGGRDQTLPPEGGDSDRDGSGADEEVPDRL